jgi:hypothetical protein
MLKTRKNQLVHEVNKFIIQTEEDEVHSNSIRPSWEIGSKDSLLNHGGEHRDFEFNFHIDKKQPKRFQNFEDEEDPEEGLNDEKKAGLLNLIAEATKVKGSYDFCAAKKDFKKKGLHKKELKSEISKMKEPGFDNAEYYPSFQNLQVVKNLGENKPSRHHKNEQFWYNQNMQSKLISSNRWDTQKESSKPIISCNLTMDN